MLHFDDQGRHAALEQNGLLVQAVRFLEEHGHSLFSVDLRGWGDTAVAATAFDLASWSGRDRMPNYLAAGLDDGLLGQRTRDAVACCRWLAGQEGVDAGRMVVVGRGLGGIVALFAAAAIEGAAGVVCIDTPRSIEEIVGEGRQTWPLDVFMPRVLSRLDLPELAGALGDVLWVRQRDALGEALDARTEGDAAAWIDKRLGL